MSSLRLDKSLLNLAVLLPVLAVAHEPTPAHGCTQPIRPPDKNDAVVWNRFVDGVDAYRACMSAFIAENHAAADRHRTAANAATEEWNGFVRSSLNVPEDFPWPPPEPD